MKNIVTIAQEKLEEAERGVKTAQKNLEAAKETKKKHQKKEAVDLFEMLRQMNPFNIPGWEYQFRKLTFLLGSGATTLEDLVESVGQPVTWKTLRALEKDWWVFEAEMLADEIEQKGGKQDVSPCYERLAVCNRKSKSICMERMDQCEALAHASKIFHARSMVAFLEDNKISDRDELHRRIMEILQYVEDNRLSYDDLGYQYSDVMELCDKA